MINRAENNNFSREHWSILACVSWSDMKVFGTDVTAVGAPQPTESI